ncbi:MULTISPECIES: GIY-YIG nuclease family protein [unclassified Sphingomonas]|uniref:GIY-YIG nuclease family protein n=1 Tax=unclassified Sphingomonas TaxID=196159 RepID=UPI00226AB4F9|nr:MULTISPECIES: GIY-YIG nuclease family protein [unclassified Sphingomonas]
MERAGYVYIMASGRNGTIYIGVTSDLPKRVWEHREGIVEGFTKTYRCKSLVWYEAYDSIEAARQRELRMKEWKRAWKVKEIEGMNPSWDDLFETLTPD